MRHQPCEWFSFALLLLLLLLLTSQSHGTVH